MTIPRQETAAEADAEPDPDPDPEPKFFELSGNYEYLTEGYYRCLDAELQGHDDIIPRCLDALDAYVVPVALEKAELAGIAIPEWYLTLRNPISAFPG